MRGRVSSLHRCGWTLPAGTPEPSPRWTSPDRRRPRVAAIRRRRGYRKVGRDGPPGATHSQPPGPPRRSHPPLVINPWWMAQIRQRLSTRSDRRGGSPSASGGSAIRSTHRNPAPHRPDPARRGRLRPGPGRAMALVMVATSAPSMTRNRRAASPRRSRTVSTETGPTPAISQISPASRVPRRRVSALIRTTHVTVRVDRPRSSSGGRTGQQVDQCVGQILVPGCVHLLGRATTAEQDIGPLVEHGRQRPHASSVRWICTRTPPSGSWHEPQRPAVEGPRPALALLVAVACHLLTRAARWQSSRCEPFRTTSNNSSPQSGFTETASPTTSAWANDSSPPANASLATREWPRSSARARTPLACANEVPDVLGQPVGGVAVAGDLVRLQLFGSCAASVQPAVPTRTTASKRPTSSVTAATSVPAIAQKGGSGRSERWARERASRSIRWSMATIHPNELAGNLARNLAGPHLIARRHGPFSS